MAAGTGSWVSVAVAGGGPAGAACALGLARRGVPVLLLEAGDGSGNPIGESLPPAATPLFHRLGVFAAVQATAPLPCHANRSCWGSDGSPAEHDFLRDPHGPGWRLDRPAFNAALLGAAAAAGATCRRRARLRAAERSAAGGWRLAVETATGIERIEVGFLVDATGRPARLARWLGARRLAFDGLVALVAILEPGGAPLRDATTLVEAAEGGWWYAALLPDGRLATAFFSDPDLLAARAPWAAGGWAALLADCPATASRVAAGGYRLAVSPTVAPAANVCLERAAGPGWLAVGDAAAAHDPLSSHGIVAALAGGERAAAAIAAHLAGDGAALDAYARATAAGYARYLRLWLAYYAQERRWPAAPFWRRRQAALDA